MADDIGVMHEGRLLQWDTPYNLYHEPNCRFVADFIGHGVFLPGTLLAPDTVETEKTNIEQAADDVSGLTGLASAVSAIGTSLTAMGTAFETALEAIENADVGGELKTALEDSDDCAELTG